MYARKNRADTVGNCARELSEKSSAKYLLLRDRHWLDSRHDLLNAGKDCSVGNHDRLSRWDGR